MEFGTGNVNQCWNGIYNAVYLHDKNDDVSVYSEQKSTVLLDSNTEYTVKFKYRSGAISTKQTGNPQFRLGVGSPTNTDVWSSITTFDTEGSTWDVDLTDGWKWIDATVTFKTGELGSKNALFLTVFNMYNYYTDATHIWVDDLVVTQKVSTVLSTDFSNIDVDKQFQFSYRSKV